VGNTGVDEATHLRRRNGRLDRVYIVRFLEAFQMCEDFVVEKALTIGHLSRRLAKPTDAKTHHWELFLYSPTGEDLAKWIAKVIFHLHPSFVPADRSTSQEPYRTQDDGWGEFEAQVEIFPKCSIEFSLVCQITFPAPNSKKAALLERREERVIFRNPQPILYEGLTAAAFTWNRFKRIKKQPKAADADLIDGPASDYDLEKKWLTSVSAASTAIRTEIQKQMEYHRVKLERIQLLVDEIRRLSPDVAAAATLFI
jgi:hypothetical protein